MTWATLDDVRARWADAPLDDVVLSSMLDAAHEQLVVYAPTLSPGDPDAVPPVPADAVPARYVEAEVLQVRALYQAQERDGDVIGYGDGFAVRVRPLGQDVKSLLRPRRGVPVVR